MFGRFLQDNAVELIEAAEASAPSKHFAKEVVENGYTVIPGAISPEKAADMIAVFRRFEALNDPIFSKHRDHYGHYPRLVNLHNALPQMIDLFAHNQVFLETLDVLFGAPTALYTSLFYETGSQQPLHRDTPVFTTRPEYMYFGTTVYLEPTDDQNGCLEVLEGGHKMPELDREAMALRRYGTLENIPALDDEAWIEYQDTVTGQGKAQGMGVRKLHVQAGDTLIWHPQLPHGGSPIADKTRTRFSMVMHVTPMNVPVYHQNVFFNPKGEFSEKPHWQYYEVSGRGIVDQRPAGVGFGHETNYPVGDFAPAE